MLNKHFVKERIMINKKAVVRYSVYAAIVTLLSMLIVYVYCGMLPFGDLTVLTGDLKGIYVPLYSWLQRVFEGDSIAYSFSKSLGGEMYANFAYYPASLYMLFLPLFKGADVALFVQITLVIKLCFASAAMTYYLASKYISDNRIAAEIGISYGLMTYSFAYAQNNMWLDNVSVLPIVLLCLEHLLDGGSLIPFAVSVFVMICNNYYTAYMICIYTVIFTISKCMIKNTGGGGMLYSSQIRYWRFFRCGIICGTITADAVTHSNK